MKNKIAVLVKVIVLAAILVLYILYLICNSRYVLAKRFFNINVYQYDVIEVENTLSNLSYAGKYEMTMQVGEGKLEAVQPELEMLQNPGVAVLLDYEGKDRIIFHGVFGLFIYDMKENKMVRMLNLAPLGCDKVQGADCCDVRVTENGEEVYLIRMEDNVYVETYIYQWRENELFRVDYFENILEKEFYDYKENRGILEEGSSIGEICYKIDGKEIRVFDDF